MVEDLVCHELQLLLLGLLWLGMLLYGLWPWLQAAAGQAHRQPSRPNDVPQTRDRLRGSPTSPAVRPVSMLKRQLLGRPVARRHA